MGAVVMASLGLVAALSRQHETAIHRVEGATRATIALQCLIEGVVLASVGALVGCGLGMVLAELRVRIEPVSGFRWIFPWREAGIAVAVAVVAGIGASWLPAMRMARQDPVMGLRDE